MCFHKTRSEKSFEIGKQYDPKKKYFDISIKFGFNFLFLIENVSNEKCQQQTKKQL